MKNLFVAGCVSIVMTGCTTNEPLTEQQEANPTQTAQSKDATLRTPEEALEIANENTNTPFKTKSRGYDFKRNVRYFGIK